MSYDTLFSPIKIRGLELKNRVVFPGMNTKMVKKKDNLADDIIGYHAARAAGGCGLNMFEPVAISPEIHEYLYMGLYTEHHRDELKKVTDAIHKNGGKAGIQIWHGGFVPQDFFDKTNKLETPDTLTVDRIHEIIKQYGHSTKLAVEAGFDVVEFHAAHTYLPHEFMNPSLNKRTDEYGNQSLENRCRFSLEVIREMRANMPDDMPLFMRLDAVDELLPKNSTVDETVQFINWAAEAGVDVADLSRGNARSSATVYEVPLYNLAPAFNMDNIAAIKARVSIPVIGVGRITYAALADQLIKDGKADMIAIGRGQLVDPEWCNKSKAGQDDLIRRCLGCCQGCYDKIVDEASTHITCNRNPELCFEYKNAMKPTDDPKNIMVIGAGIAGLQVSEYLKRRGHNPVVYEASGEVGGNFVLAGAAPKKAEFAKAAKWEAEEIKRLGVEIKLNTPVTPELLAEVKPDYVIVATGAKCVFPDIPGIDGKDIYDAHDVLAGKVQLSGNVVLLGGSFVGIETATYLHAKGCQVAVIDMRKVGRGMGMLRKMFMDMEFPEYGIKRLSRNKVYEVKDHKVLYHHTDPKTKKVTDKEKEFDSLVICTGNKANPHKDLQEKCTELGIPFSVIGDAKKAGMGIDATAEAFETASKI